MGIQRRRGTKLSVAVSAVCQGLESRLLLSGTGPFSAPAQYAVESEPQSVAVGDFNGDGKPVLAVANVNGASVSILLNNGNGTFAPQTTVPVGSGPDSILVGDFNGDGKLDLAVANYFSDTVSILLGNGNGTFAPQTTFPVGNDPRGIAVGDFNGDGKLDLAVANFHGADVSVLMGNGNGTFHPQIYASVDSGPDSIAVGDFNGDGKQDLAVVNNADDNVSILLGNGNGTFASQTTVPVGAGPDSIVAGDFNHDGKLDLAVANYSGATASLLLGNGNGTFAPQTTVPVGDDPQAIAAADFNGDGKLDLAVVNSSDSTVSVVLGNGDGTFAYQTILPVGLLPHGIAVGDFNGDGKPDLAIGNKYQATVSVLLNTEPSRGGGTFSSQEPIAVGNEPATVVAADFNGDGNPDLAVANYGSGTVSILLGYGDGIFTPQTTVSVGSGPDSIAVGDFTQDGHLDLAVANKKDNTVSILLGNGNGTFAPQTILNVGSFPTSIVAGDFNGDGKLDLAVADDGGKVSVYLGNGDGTFAYTSTVTLGVSNYPYFLAVGDFNGDGKPDLAVSSDANSSLTILLGNGNGTFSTGQTLGVGQTPLDIIAGDFNGDGKLDLATANYQGDSVSVLLGNGNGTFKPQTNFPVGNHPVSVVEGDFNDDGKPDLATTNFGYNTASILYGNGDGTFAAQKNIPAGNSPQSIAVSDFTGDGETDLAVANQNTGTVTLHLNSPSIPPIVNSNSSATFGVGTYGSFNIATTGSPEATITEMGTLPSGLTFQDDVNGTATLLGIPALGTGGTYVLTFTADNGVLPAGTQNFTLTVDQSPGLASASSASFIVSTSSTFTIIGTGFPTDSLSESGTLPTGVSFTDNGNGTATLFGTPAANSEGNYDLTFTASAPASFSNQTISSQANIYGAGYGDAPDPGGSDGIGYGGGTTPMEFDLPAISNEILTFTSVTGSITLNGAGNFNDPDGVGAAPSTSFNSGYRGISGITAPGAGYLVGVFETDSAPGDSPPAGLDFTSIGTSFASLTPALYQVFYIGDGLTGDGTGSAQQFVVPSGATRLFLGISDAPGYGGQPGNYDDNAGAFTASFQVSASAQQSFTLAVDQVPSISSGSSATFIAGSTGTFTVTANGFPTSAITETGALPAGVSLVDNGNGTAFLAGVPSTSAAGTYTFTISATNGAMPAASESFTLTVVAAPTVTQGTSGVITINGANANNTGTVVVSGGNVVVTIDGQQQTFAINSVTGVNISLGSGNDSISIGDGVPSASISGGDGNDTITATNSVPDSIGGGAGNDSIMGMGTGDSLGGGGGNDTIMAGNTDQTVGGGSGNDSLMSMNGGDMLNGGAGDDFFFDAGDGSGDSINGGAGLNFAQTNGKDMMSNIFQAIDPPKPTSPSVVRLVPAQASDASAVVSNGVLTVTGSAEADTITVAPNAKGTKLKVTVDGQGLGSFAISGLSGVAIAGKGGADTISVSSSVTLTTTLKGGGANDSITGGGGDNVLVGGGGSDTLVGGGGENLLIADQLFTYSTGTGQDSLVGGGGLSIADFSYRTDALDVSNNGALTGGEIISSNVSAIWGGTGNDSIAGTTGGEFLSGGAGADTIQGGGVNDFIVGGKGKDSVMVAAEPVTLYMKDNADDTVSGVNDPSEDIIISDPGDSIGIL